jgi:intracellular sulfur oxidation DsrE/DsrF family protein
MRHFWTYRFPGHRRSIVRAFGSAMMVGLMAATISSARAEQAPLPDKPFAEHRVVLQLSDNDPRKQGLVISVANNLLKFYDPDKVAIEVVTFGPGIDLLRPDNTNRKLVESLVAQGVRFDACLNTVDTIERETGKRPDIIPAATPVQVGVGQILSLTENGYTLVRP